MAELIFKDLDDYESGFVACILFKEFDSRGYNHWIYLAGWLAGEIDVLETKRINREVKPKLQGYIRK